VAFSFGGCKKEEEKPAAPAAAPSSAAAPVDLATAGNVTGTVKLDGTPPKSRPLNMAAEPACFKEHGSAPVPNEEFVTGEAGALANVLIYVKEGLGNRVFPTPKEPAVIDQKGCLYRPRIVPLQTGQTLQVTNSDPITHNIHPVPSLNREWNKSQPAGAQAIKETFARVEVAIPVKCNVHPWMRSYFAVISNPYFAVTAKDGKFELNNLPPGNYVIEAWHEKLGTAQEKVTLSAKETKAISFTFKAPAGD